MHHSSQILPVLTSLAYAPGSAEAKGNTDATPSAPKRTPRPFANNRCGPETTGDRVATQSLVVIDNTTRFLTQTTTHIKIVRALFLIASPSAQQSFIFGFAILDTKQCLGNFKHVFISELQNLQRGRVRDLLVLELKSATCFMNKYARAEIWRSKRNGLAVIKLTYAMLALKDCTTTSLLEIRFDKPDGTAPSMPNRM